MANCRHWSDATFCGIWSVSTLFAKAYLSQYLGLLWYPKNWSIPFDYLRCITRHFFKHKSIDISLISPWKYILWVLIRSVLLLACLFENTGRGRAFSVIVGMVSNLHWHLHHWSLPLSCGLIQQITNNWYFTYFSQKTGFGISCKLSQISSQKSESNISCKLSYNLHEMPNLFSVKIKKNISICHQ